MQNSFYNSKLALERFLSNIPPSPKDERIILMANFISQALKKPESSNSNLK